MNNENNLKFNCIYTGVNYSIIGLIGFYTLLLILFSNNLDHSNYIALSLVVLTIISFAVIIISNRIKSGKTAAVMQVIYVFGFFGFFYELSSKFQFILHNQWQDNKLIAIDKFLFGSETSLIMQKITIPLLTEAMMFAYVFYLPLLLIVAFIAYKGGSEAALSEYLFILSLGYSICYIGFIIFPVAGQMYFMPEKYYIHLDGGLFTYLGELIRSDAHFPGGNLPSPHCMAASIMLYTLYKNNRNFFYLFLPVTLILYISTVYCRYHYIWDGIIAVMLAVILIKLFPLLKKFINILRLFFQSIMHPLCISETLSEY